MPFRLIKGRFAPRLGRPDGDSVRFIPDRIALFRGLKGRDVKIHTSQGVRSVQLRYEGIDTLEKGAVLPHSSEATRANLRFIGGEGSATQEDTRGFILTRRIGPNRRPISFVYSGTVGIGNGADVFADVQWVRRSVNYRLVRSGHAYPMYYNTLFAELRAILTRGVRLSRDEGKGLWPADRSRRGVLYGGPDSLSRLPPIFPKLWRRLRRYGGVDLSGFLEFIRSTREHLTTMSDDRDLQFEDVIVVKGNRVGLSYPPEDLKFRGRDS